MKSKMMKTTTHRVICSSRVALAAFLLAGGCDLQDPEDGWEDPEVEELSFRGTGFGQVLRDMANAAASAYGTPDEGQPIEEIVVGGNVHTRAPTLTNDSSGVRVSVFEYQTCSNASIVVSFRGTSIPDFDDLKADATGATMATLDPSNPWDSSIVIDDTATVGQGFYQRVKNYMDSREGEALREYLERLKNGPQEVNIHVVGHSLGGVSSAIFSQFLAQYTKKEGYDRDKFKHYNFAFNSPLGMNGTFRNDSDRGFYGLARGGWFRPFGFNVEGDKVSDSNFLCWSKTYDDSTTVDLPSGGSYRPFAHLSLPGAGLLQKHKLDVNIGQWADLVDSRADMNAAYNPFPVGGLAPEDTNECGCELYIEQACKLTSGG